MRFFRHLKKEEKKKRIVVQDGPRRQTEVCDLVLAQPTFRI